MTASKSTIHNTEVELVSLFLRNGYKRVQDAERLKKEGWAKYKKVQKYGWLHKAMLSCAASVHYCVALIFVWPTPMSRA